MDAPKYTAGQYVLFTNDYGVKIGVKRIESIATEHFLSEYEPHYFIVPSDSPWCPVAERNLEPVEVETCPT